MITGFAYLNLHSEPHHISAPGTFILMQHFKTSIKGELPAPPLQQLAT